MPLSIAGNACPSGFEYCNASATRPCVPGVLFCDGNDDCGNGWDEDPEQCGECCVINMICIDSFSYLFKYTSDEECKRCHYERCARLVLIGYQTYLSFSFGVAHVPIACQR